MRGCWQLDIRAFRLSLVSERVLAPSRPGLTRLDPAIQVFLAATLFQTWMGRDKPEHDELRPRQAEPATFNASATHLGSPVPMKRLPGFSRPDQTDRGLLSKRPYCVARPYLTWPLLGSTTNLVVAPFFTIVTS
jgi:hypothetical protein